MVQELRVKLTWNSLWKTIWTERLREGEDSVVMSITLLRLPNFEAAFFGPCEPREWKDGNPVWSGLCLTEDARTRAKEKNLEGNCLALSTCIDGWGSWFAGSLALALTDWCSRLEKHVESLVGHVIDGAWGHGNSTLRDFLWDLASIQSRRGRFRSQRWRIGVARKMGWGLQWTGWFVLEWMVGWCGWFTLVCLLAVLVDVPEFIFQGQRGSWPPSPWHQKLMHPNHPITACPLQTAMIDYGWTYEVSYGGNANCHGIIWDSIFPQKWTSCNTTCGTLQPLLQRRVIFFIGFVGFCWLLRVWREDAIWWQESSWHEACGSWLSTTRARHVCVWTVIVEKLERTRALPAEPPHALDSVTCSNVEDF